MNRARFLTLLGVLLVGRGAGAHAQTPAGVGLQAARLRVAVMDLTGSALKMQTAQAPMPQGGMQQTQTVTLPPPPEFARALTEILTTTLVNTQRFIVLERQQGQAVLTEQDFNASGRVNKETAAAQGGIIGAQALITGDITGWAYTQQALGGNALNLVKGLSTSASRVTARVIIDLRLIDAVTGEVLTSAKGTGNASATGVGADLTKGDQRINTATAWTSPLGNASREAIGDAVKQMLATMPKVSWAGRVVDVRDGVVFINSGSDAGMKAGLVLEVYEVQPVLVDPDTGKNLGAPERLLGSIEVTEVQARFATARVRDGAGFARGNLVRLLP